MGAEFKNSPITIVKKNETAWIWPDKWETPVLIRISGNKVSDLNTRGEFDAIVLNGRIFTADSNVQRIGINQQFLVIPSPGDRRIYKGEITGFKRISQHPGSEPEKIKVGEVLDVAGVQIRGTYL